MTANSACVPILRIVHTEPQNSDIPNYYASDDSRTRHISKATTDTPVSTVQAQQKSLGLSGGIFSHCQIKSEVLHFPKHRGSIMDGTIATNHCLVLHR